DLERGRGGAGDEILYVGDHIYGDILRSKKESAWRTAMIIQELEGEVLAHDSCRDDFARGLELEDTRDRLEDELRFYQNRFKEMTRRLEHAAHPPKKNGSNGALNGSAVDAEAERPRIKRAIDRVRARLRQVDTELHASDPRIDH